MHSATSSEGLRLVTFVVPCAQTRVTIETHLLYEWHEVLCILVGLFSSLKRQGLLLILPGRFIVRAE